MIALETLITNELKSILEHEPTPEELHSLSEFLATQQITYLTEMDNKIHDWANCTTKQCAWCGERWLPTEMIHTAGNESFCCEQCKADYKQEHSVSELGD